MLLIISLLSLIGSVRSSNSTTSEPPTDLIELFSPSYGTNNDEYSVIDYGRIDGINNWGYDSNGYQLVINGWSYTNTYPQSVSVIYLDPYTECASFTLNSGDSIIGYTIYYDTLSVYGLQFHTLFEYTHSCLSPDHQNKMVDTFTPGGYLTGWNAQPGITLDTCQFKFTCGTYNNYRRLFNCESLIMATELIMAKGNVKNADSVDHMSKSTLNDGFISMRMYLIIYSVIGLILLIVIIFIIYCCLKARNKYKEISMKSVECEQDVENQSNM
eukprot:532402_1